jgi:hypothetical protein
MTLEQLQEMQRLEAERDEARLALDAFDDALGRTEQDRTV